MAIYIAVLAYVVVWGFAARRSALRALEEAAQRGIKHHQHMTKYGESHDEPLVDHDDRITAMLMGLMVGMCWPVTLPGSYLAGALRAPSEIAYLERVELEKLRKLAKEHNLPYVIE